MLSVFGKMGMERHYNSEFYKAEKGLSFNHIYFVISIFSCSVL